MGPGGQCEMVNNPDAVLRYQNRAEELRVFATTIKDPKIRKDIEDWAKEYEEMALLAGEVKRTW